MSLTLYIGPMCAGKSTAMLHDLERYRIAGKKCVIIKHKLDTRYDNLAITGGIVCHSGFEYSKIMTVVSETLADVEVSNFDVIGVSEIQFYSDAILADDWANIGKIVICEGLNGDFQRNEFPRIIELIPKCEKVKSLSAVCIHCGSSAHFTKKVSGDMDKIVDIGTHDKYTPMCRKCYRETETSHTI